ncbi:hypothetical protein ACIQTT_07310 [Microbacterium sp. NPDC090225]
MTNILGGVIGYGLFLLVTRSRTIAGFVEHFRWPVKVDRRPSSQAAL